MAFLAVLREGFETVVFLLATFHASGNATASWLGAVLGPRSWPSSSATASTRAASASTWPASSAITGVVLVVIAAGLVMTAVHTANEAGWLSFGQNQAFDLSWLVRPGTPLSSFVTGVLGIQPYPVWVEVIAYLVYLVPMLLVMCLAPEPRRTGLPHRSNRPTTHAIASTHDPRPNQSGALTVAPPSSSHRRARRASRRVAATAVGSAASSAAGSWRCARRPRSPPSCRALAAPAGAEATQTHGDDHPDPAGLRAEAGQGAGRRRSSST